MPGANDPTNYVLPQQPLHRCMFPLSEKLSTLNMVTNPYRCNIDDLVLAGTSGQPTSDILKNSCMKDPLDALEKTLVWGHLCPTAPDTLGCYPFENEDPFIFDRYPDVYFAGNQEKFSYRIWDGKQTNSAKFDEKFQIDNLQHLITGQNRTKRRVCLLTIPRFSESSSVVLLDTASLDCFTLTISVDQHTS